MHTSSSLIFSSAVFCLSISWLLMTSIGCRINLKKQIRLTTLHGLYFWLCQWPPQKLTCVRHPRKAAYYQAAWRSRRAWAWHVYVHGSADQSAGRIVLPSAVCQSSSPATPRRPRRHGEHWVTLRLKTRQRDRQISVVLLAMRIDKS